MNIPWNYTDRPTDPPEEDEVEDKGYIKGEDPAYDEFMEDMRKTLIDIGSHKL